MRCDGDALGLALGLALGADGDALGVAVGGAIAHESENWPMRECACAPRTTTNTRRAAAPVLAQRSTPSWPPPWLAPGARPVYS